MAICFILKKSVFHFSNPSLKTNLRSLICCTRIFSSSIKQSLDHFAPHFEEVFTAYENSKDKQHKVASIKLLALLYELKDFTIAFNQWGAGIYNTATDFISKIHSAYQ
jgi:AraC family transcriptional activator of pobA